MKNIFENLESVWSRLKNGGKPVALYGMGDGADKVLRAFDRFGITARAVMASDGFVRGQSFHGFRVKTLTELENEFGDFDIALCFASQLDEVMNTVKSVAEKHTVLVPSVPVFGNVLFDDEFIAENADDIEKAYSLLSDEHLKKVYENVLKFYYTGELFCSTKLPPTKARLLKIF